MTDNAQRTNNGHRQQPADEIVRHSTVLEGGSGRSFAFSLYGLWVGAGWVLEQIRAKAKAFELAESTGILHRKEAPIDAGKADASTKSTSFKIGEPVADQSVTPPSLEPGQLSAEAAFASNTSSLRPATVFGGPETNPIDGTDFNEPNSHGAEDAPSSAGVKSQPSVPGSGSGAAQTKNAESIWPSNPPELAEIFEFQLFDEPTLQWTEIFGPVSQAFTSEIVTTIGGDYFDFQLGIEIGSLVPLATLDDGADITMGSMLISAASDYDLVVIDEDLFEINIILQQNVGMQVDTLMSELTAATQGNLAVIADYTDSSGLQITLGDEINVTSIQQMNHAANASTAEQLNYAAVLSSVRSDGLSDLDAFMPSELDVDLEELASLTSTEEIPEVLHVTGSYYEVNLIYQSSGPAGQDNSDTQFNGAVLKDFDGIAENQIVGGDQYDLNAISQVNYLSQIDQHIPDVLNEIFPDVPGSSGTALSSNGKSDTHPANGTPAATHIPEAIMNKLPDTSAVTGSFIFPDVPEKAGAARSSGKPETHPAKGTPAATHIPEAILNKLPDASAVTGNFMDDLIPA